MVALKALPFDDAVTLAKCLEAALPMEARQQTRVMAVDNPSHELQTKLRPVLPKLQTLCLDTCHLAMTYEYASSKKRTPGSKRLRHMLAQFHCVEPDIPSDTWGPVYQGVNPPRLTGDEAAALFSIEHRNMSRRKATMICNGLDVLKPFMLRVELSSSVWRPCALSTRRRWSALPRARTGPSTNCLRAPRCQVEGTNNGSVHVLSKQ